MKIKFNFPKTTKLGYLYLFIMFFVSMSVAKFGSDEEDHLVRLLYILLWFFTLMAGYTGWVKETKKYEEREEDNESA